MHVTCDFCDFRFVSLLINELCFGVIRFPYFPDAF
jgi:hypothetical protein